MVKVVGVQSRACRQGRTRLRGSWRREMQEPARRAIIDFPGRARSSLTHPSRRLATCRVDPAPRLAASCSRIIPRIGADRAAGNANSALHARLGNARAVSTWKASERAAKEASSRPSGCNIGEDSRRADAGLGRRFEKCLCSISAARPRFDRNQT